MIGICLGLISVGLSLGLGLGLDLGLGMDLGLGLNLGLGLGAIDEANAKTCCTSI
jgi:hypothetical protein